MPTKLKNLVITKVALVDEGSCSAAHIKLFKRKEGGQTMNYEEILKSLSEEQRAVIAAEVAKAQAAMPEGAVSAEDKKKMEEAMANSEVEKKAAQEEVAKLKKELDGAHAGEEELLKNVDPAVRALIEKSNAKAAAAEAAVKKMAEERENADFIAKAKEVSFVPEAETKVTELLKSVKGVDGAVDKVMDILKSVNTVIAKGAAFKEVGTGGSTGGDDSSAEEAWSAIEKAAADLVTKGQGQLSKAKAIDMVISTQPELYNAYITALRAE